MSQPRKVSLGRPFTEFPGRSFNALVDAHYAKSSASRQIKPQRGREPSGARPQVQVLLHNPTSTTLEPGEVLGVAGNLFDWDDAPNNFYGTPLLAGAEPDADEHANRFAVALDYIRGTDGPADGAVGPAAVLGYAHALVNFTDESHTHCSLATGERLLQSGSSGIEIIDHETLPGELPASVKCLIFLGGTTTTIRTARVTTAITAASDNLAENWGTGEVILLSNATGAEEGDPIEVANPLQITFGIDYWVELDASFSPPQVRNGSCGEWQWAEES